MMCELAVSMSHLCDSRGTAPSSVADAPPVTVGSVVIQQRAVTLSPSKLAFHTHTHKAESLFQIHPGSWIVSLSKETREVIEWARLIMNPKPIFMP